MHQVERIEDEVHNVSTASSSAVDARISATQTEIDQLKDKSQACERRTDGISSQQVQERSHVERELESIKGRLSTLGLAAVAPPPPPPPPHAAQSLEQQQRQLHAPLSRSELQEVQVCQPLLSTRRS